MREIESKFDLFKSLVDGLAKHLFPTGTIRNEASDVEIADQLLNNPDIGLFLTPEFVKEMKEKLHLKAQGVIKQARINNEGIEKFADSEIVGE